MASMLPRRKTASVSALYISFGVNRALRRRVRRVVLCLVMQHEAGQWDDGIGTDRGRWPKPRSARLGHGDRTS
jgi:hypothetical protein